MKLYQLFIFLTILLASCAKPIANFSSISTEKQAPAKYKFENKSLKAEGYEWDFGDGTKSSEISPQHEYLNSGHYTIKLIATKGKKKSVFKQQIFVDAPHECTVEIKTDYGIMVAILYNATPQHRENFMKLADEGFYNGLLFHRVIENFMIQGGDPTSRDAPTGKALGSGDPGYMIPAEFIDSLVHIKGALAAARTSDAINPERKSSGSQFYIVQGQPISSDFLDRIERQKGIKYLPSQRKAYIELGGTPQLDRDYTVFGRVIKGIDVIDKIAAVEKARGDRPKQDVKMEIRVIK